MTWWRRVVTRRTLEGQLDEELRDHFDRLTQEHIRRGRSDAEARRLARLELGGGDQLKEECRDARGTRWLHDADQDIRFAWRRLIKQRGASIAAVATLACAIGAGAATWALLDAVLIRPLRIDSPETLAVVGYRDPQRGSAFVPTLTYPHFPHVKRAGVFTHVVASGRVGLTAGPSGAAADGRIVSFVSHDYFDVVGMEVALGRTFIETDDVRSAPPTAVLSDRYWRLAFGADAGVVGKTLAVRGTPVTIVGVAPRGFREGRLTGAPDFYMPLETVEQVTAVEANYFGMDVPGKDSPYGWLTIMVRLAPNMTLEQAKAKLKSLEQISVRQGRGFELVDANTAALPDAIRLDMQRFARLLAATVGMLLLSGAMSVGMLLLMRTEARTEEFAMCLALGASRVRLARGVIFEGTLLTIGGAVLALPVAEWLLDGVRAFQLPGGMSIELLELSIDRRAWLVVAALASVAAMVMALFAATFGFPALRVQSLRSRPGATPRMTGRRTRTALVVAQMAVALVLLAGAGLFARSLAARLELNPGVDARSLVTGSLSLANYGYSRETARKFFDDFASRLRINPAVRAVSIAASTGGMSPRGQLFVDGTPRGFPTLVSFISVDSAYFSTMGLRVTRGRNFGGDDRLGAPPVVLVSASFARMLADGADALGRQVNTASQVPARVVGVVSDVIVSVAVPEPLVVYFPIAQVPPLAWRSIAIRAAGETDVAAAEARALIKELDPRIAPPVLATLDEQLASQMSVQRFGATVLGGLGGIAALLTLLGTYVVASVMAGSRRREMGIRAALGAKGSELARLILGDTAKLVGLGIALGLALAWLGAGTIRPFLFRTQPLDAWALGSVAVSMFVLALLVCLRPTLSASRIDLSRVLREA